MALKQKISIFAFTFIAFVTGLSLFFAANKDYFIERDPAAVPGKLMNFNNLTSDQLRDELVKKIKFKLSFNAENLPTKSIVFSGLSSQLCQSYSEIQMEFVADGMSSSGEPSQLKITIPCSAGQDPSELAAVQLPIQEILNEHVRNAEFTFNGYNGIYQFSHMTDEWATTWVLKTLHFTNSASGSEKRSVDFVQTISPTTTPLVLQF